MRPLLRCMASTAFLRASCATNGVGAAGHGARHAQGEVPVACTPPSLRSLLQPARPGLPAAQRWHGHFQPLKQQAHTLSKGQWAEAPSSTDCSSHTVTSLMAGRPAAPGIKPISLESSKCRAECLHTVGADDDLAATLQ